MDLEIKKYSYTRYCRHSLFLKLARKHINKYNSVFRQKILIYGCQYDSEFTKHSILYLPLHDLISYGDEKILDRDLKTKKFTSDEWDYLFKFHVEIMVKLIHNCANIEKLIYSSFHHCPTKCGMVINTLYDIGVRNLLHRNIVEGIDQYERFLPNIGLFEYLQVVCKSELHNAKNILMDYFEKHDGFRIHYIYRNFGAEHLKSACGGLKSEKMAIEISRCLEKLRERENYIVDFHKNYST
jgi:hypothetical protein